MNNECYNNECIKQRISEIINTIINNERHSEVQLTHLLRLVASKIISHNITIGHSGLISGSSELSNYLFIKYHYFLSKTFIYT